VGQSLRTDKDGMPQMGYYQLNEAVDKLLREIVDAQ
jgi:hypothetical protein